jgi:hypothetical protein
MTRRSYQEWLTSSHPAKAYFLAIGTIVVLVLFWLDNISVMAVEGWWLDDLFSLDVTDPARKFTVAFRQHMIPDSNPPLYYTCLYWIRSLISDDRSAILALNLLALLAAGAVVIFMSWRRNLLLIGVVSLWLFILSGPVLAYMPEGRVYLAAFALCFVASSSCALAIEDQQRRPAFTGFAILGILGAMLHVYAALICGSLAAGLLSIALLCRRRDLIAPGLALGVSTSLTLLVWLKVWMVVISGNPDPTSWIAFTSLAVRSAMAEFLDLTLGSQWLAIPIAGLFVLGVAQVRTRQLALSFGVALIVFLAIPLAVSFFKPIIVGRYWLIAAPVVIVATTYLARAWWLQAGEGGSALAVTAAVASAALLIGSNALGPYVARETTADRPIWRGASVAGPLLSGCPAASVHVRAFGIASGFARTSGAPASTFVDAESPSTRPLTLDAATCPVLGWAEHVDAGGPFMGRASDADLLSLLKIDAPPGSVTIKRHATGYVVLRPAS